MPQDVSTDALLRGARWGSTPGYYALTATSAVRRPSDGVTIPADPRNADYQDFLAWVAAGNTPTPYVAPPPAVPQSVSNFQCRAVLLNTPSSVAGKSLFDLVDAYAKAQGGVTLAAWDHAQIVERTSPLIATIASGAVLNLTDAQIDALFVAAAGVGV